MSFVKWLPFMQLVNSYITLTIGTLLNLLLIYLVVKKSSKELKSYNRMLLWNCAFDMYFGVIVYFSEFLIEAANGVFVFIMTSFLKPLPVVYHCLVAAMTVAGLHWVIAYLPVQYYYRYNAIKSGKTLSTAQLAVALGLVGFSGISTGAFCFYAFWWTAQSGVDYSFVVDNDLWRNADGTLPRFIAGNVHTLPMRMYFTYAMLNNMAAYNLVFMFIWRTGRIMKRNSAHFSEKTKKLQRQLYYSLLVQTLAPVFTVFTPTNIFIMSTFLGLRLNGLGCLNMMIHAWTAIINPLSTLLLVENFRKRILSPFSSKTSIGDVTTTHSQAGK